jgi:hypothetical protein
LQENNEQNDRERDKLNGNVKKREFSESESSWSSVEEMEIKVITEGNDEEDNLERSKEEPQRRLPRQKSKGSGHESEIMEDREKAAQFRPLLTPSS